MSILIKNGRLIDPANNIDDHLDLLLKDGLVAAVGKNLSVDADETLDADGKLVTPGLIDLHVHLRDPGQEYKEDIASGTAAAVAGGFTSVVCMPNTQPVNDNLAVTKYILSRSEEVGRCRVFPVASITRGLKGENLTEMGELKQGGAVAFSDDGRPVENGEVMRRALEYARPFDAPIISHAEDLSLVGKGVMNDGFVATELGLKGIPWVAEDAMVARDVMLAEYTGGHMHIAHISTRGAVEIVRRAKERGVRVTCEATPHHFTLTEEAVRGYDTNAKMNPPLRTEADREAVRRGLADGTIDAIATDHAPHHRDEKNVEFNIACNGIVGLETALPLALRLVRDKVMDLPRMVALFTSGPADVLGLDCGSLAAGQPADVTLIDPDCEWTLTADQLVSKSKNTPFDGWTLQGAAITTIVGGKIAWQRAEQQ
ncbi:dihydroorotase [Geothermobacter hydrogeniphilus]|uniref:Dihydroorotase n=1 Tax=Geothermobacter hydrogeniphilus TaxID=1969733 RepID=A0A2K2H6Z1_9BACT|nr:dihydroorotase [Geothermobacter hydrogeniphilus]PNU19076.1 dihydroorotase [Geothermobacter hydrogeniphilus]